MKTKLAVGIIPEMGCEPLRRVDFRGNYSFHEDSRGGTLRDEGGDDHGEVQKANGIHYARGFDYVELQGRAGSNFIVIASIGVGRMHSPGSGEGTGGGRARIWPVA